MFGLTASGDRSAATELVWSVGVILDVILLLDCILDFSRFIVYCIVGCHRGSISFCSGHCMSMFIVSKRCFPGQNADVGAGELSV